MGVVLALLALGGVLTGCSGSSSSTPTAPATTATPPATVDDILPKHAQPKLTTMRLYVGPEVVDAELALTPEQEMTGMMYRTNIQETDAMLFVLPYNQQANFWMKNCPESISAAYIDDTGIIQEVHHLQANDTNGVVSASANIRFVLETKENWFQRHNINPGVAIATDKGSLADTFLKRQ